MSDCPGARAGIVLASGVEFAIGPRTGRKVDVSVYFAGRKPEPNGVVRVPPDIVIEVSSPESRDKRRDRIEKMDDYAAFGVRWYWLGDPQWRTFEIWELGGDGRYVRACAAIGGRVDPAPGCEGLALDLDELWAKVDELIAQ